jgi:hypothetical protein
VVEWPSVCPEGRGPVVRDGRTFRVQLQFLVVWCGYSFVVGYLLRLNRSFRSSFHFLVCSMRGLLRIGFAVGCFDFDILPSFSSSLRQRSYASQLYTETSFQADVRCMDNLIRHLEQAVGRGWCCHATKINVLIGGARSRRSSAAVSVRLVIA